MRPERMTLLPWSIPVSLHLAGSTSFTTMSASSKSAARSQSLIHRRDKVLAVLHPPTAAHARIMEKAGCEALFVGTGGVVGARIRATVILTAF